MIRSRLMPRTDRKLRKLAIVPAYNEGGMVGRVVRDIDRAGARLRRARRRRRLDRRDRRRAPRPRAPSCIRHPFNLGIGGAVQSGYKYALREGYDVAVQVDGDGQHKPELPAGDARGSCRRAATRPTWSTAAASAATPATRCRSAAASGNLIFSVVLTAITRQRITDPTSGFRMTNRRGIELFARDYPHDYPEVEAILMLHAHRLRIHEVPVRMNARGFGRSSIDYPRSAYYMVKVLLAIFVGLFRRRPTPVEATGEEEPGVGRPRRGGLSRARCDVASSLAAGRSRCSALRRASAATLHVTETRRSGAGLARRDDPRGRPGDTIDDPAGHHTCSTNGDTMHRPAQHPARRRSRPDDGRSRAAAARRSPDQRTSGRDRSARRSRPRAATGGSQIETQAQIVAADRHRRSSAWSSSSSAAAASPSATRCCG